MENTAKRQWMQSFDGRIRVGPKYQAMIPPFARMEHSTTSRPHYQEIKTDFGKGINYSNCLEYSMQSYSDIADFDGVDEDFDILKYVKCDLVTPDACCFNHHRTKSSSEKNAI